MRFNAQFGHFEAQWGYCEAAPGRSWAGDRIGAPVRLRVVTESGAEIEEVGIGGSFRVRVEFDEGSEPAGGTWPVTVRSPGVGETIEVVAEKDRRARGLSHRTHSGCLP
jgi:hypothetical protein